MRILAATMLVLAACGDADRPSEEALAGGEREASDDGRVECAAQGAATFERVCTMERVQGPDGTTLTIRHPDGGFRRLLVTTDGRGVVAADGADPAAVRVISDQLIEVALAGDRYRLPATIKGSSR